MNKSNRHHYIPEFLIKNFTDIDGLLFVYNKTKKKIVNIKQSPKSIFFEMNRNTVDFSGEKLDNLEQLYAEIDNRISIDLKNVLEKKQVTPEQLTSIALLACQLKWRVPKIDKEFNSIKENLTQKDLSIKITVKDKTMLVNEKAITEIENSDIFRETKRVLLPMLPLLNEHKLLEIHNNSFIQTNTYFPSLIGDSPVLEKANTDINTIEDFVLPLSSTDTFIYKKGTSKQISNVLFFIQRDLVIMDTAIKYVGCRSKEHLEKIIGIYNQIENNDELKNIKEYLFNYID
jgi:hypothetical protein